MSKKTPSVPYLAQLRVKAGLTQADVSKKLGLATPQYISNIERGVCLLSPHQMKKVAKIYKVKPMILVDHWISIKREMLIAEVC